jgi:integrase
LLYGSGLRLLEALRLRVQDLDFGMKQLTVRDGRARWIACSSLKAETSKATSMRHQSHHKAC